MISLIVARNMSDGIGIENRLPWSHLPSDMKHFKKITTGKKILMGRRTFESIGSKPLPNRQNIVASSSESRHYDGVMNIRDAYEYCRSFSIANRRNREDEELVIIGGGSLYNTLLPLTDRIYLTEIYSDEICDTFFTFNESEWKELSCVVVETDELNHLKHKFRILERR